MNRQRFTAALELIPVLAERFPAAFAVSPRYRRPLKLGIHVDILAQLGETIAPQTLSDALRIYTGNPHYCKACAAGAERVDLNGQPAGAVSEEHAATSRARRKAWLDKRKAKQKQAAVAAAKPTEPPKPVAPAAPAPSRIGLADLRAAANARRAVA